MRQRYLNLTLGSNKYTIFSLSYNDNDTFTLMPGKHPVGFDAFEIGSGTWVDPAACQGVPVEGAIVGTSESSAGWGGPASRLIDGLGLDGNWGSNGCSHTNNDVAQPGPWVSLELDSPRTVTKVQIVTGWGHSGNPQYAANVKIYVGPSQQPDDSEPLCLPEIAQIPKATLVDYECTGDPKIGKFVKITRPPGYLTLCEVKVFVV